MDDEPLLTRLGEEFLKRLGYEVVTTTCPLDAVEKFTQAHFDAVITDLTMPGLTGIELAKELRKSRPDIPVVLTTAFHQKLEGKNAIDLGFSGLLLKPYNLQALDRALSSCLPTQS